MLISPKNEIKDLRDYVGFSQNLQKYINEKDFIEISKILIKVKLIEKNKFFIIQALRQTFPHKKNISSWNNIYLKAISDLKINQIKTFGE